MYFQHAEKNRSRRVSNEVMGLSTKTAGFYQRKYVGGNCAVQQIRKVERLTS